jgi:hypothetical protein
MFFCLSSTHHMVLGGVGSGPSTGTTPCMGLVIDMTNRLATCRGFPKFSTGIVGSPFPSPSWLLSASLLVVVVRCSCLVNTILIARFRARTKVMACFSAIPIGKVAGKGMDSLDFPRAVHNMNGIRVKSL